MPSSAGSTPAAGTSVPSPITPHRSPARASARASWPRVYAQRIATHEIFELHRGTYSHRDVFSYSNGEFGPAWVIWVETRPAQVIGAHRPRCILSPVASGPSPAGAARPRP
jgi:hypothetical protein